MGEFGDALSTAISSQSDSRPSIFEVLAEDNLNSATRHAIGHVVKVLAENYPHYFNLLQCWFHEVYTVAECAIQHHFLSTYSASFAEYYYDLKRAPSPSVPNSSVNFPLGKRLHFLSIVALTVFPYLQIKLDEKYNQVREKYFIKGPKELSFIERTLLFCYPYIYFLWNISVLFYNFSYAIGKSDFHSPYHQALRIKLQYSADRLEEKDTGRFSGTLTQLLTGSVSAGMFVVQFMEWWFDGDNDNPVKQVVKDYAPQAPICRTEDSNIPVPSNEICPLCNK